MIEHCTIVLLYLFIMFGFCLFMSDMDEIQEIISKSKIKVFLLFLSAFIFIASNYVKRADILIVVLLAAEYIFILCWSKKNMECLLLKGFAYIAAMIGVELVTMAVCHSGMEKHGLLLEECFNRIFLGSLLGMALVSILLKVLSEIIQIRSYFKRSLFVIVLLKILEELVLLYIDMFSEIMNDKCMIKALVYLLMILGDYVIYVFLALNFKKKNIQAERADIQMNAYEYYLNMEEEHRLIRKMYHDMQNQLMIYENETDLPQNEYMQTISDNLKTMNYFYHTGLVSLDILLFNGKKKAEEKGIEFEAAIQEGSLAFMEEEDVGVIFSNAIMNAIEACEKITNGTKKIIIKAGTNLDDTLIYFKNTVSEERRKGKLATEKKNKRFHGIGLMSIQETAEKYNGHISIIEEDSTFQLAILFAGKSDKNENIHKK